ncbi:MAG TPA: dihydropteroate synthase [Vicinamibacterales bacterium]|jgi:dihydropteroate synthase|nr:dihydropteroate synthase [Vicinamibacterales bacterium]
MFANRQHFVVPLPGGRALELGPRTLVMGILNVTPDSFADGGLRFDPERAIADGRRMIDDGADIVDVGGESTRPGAAPVSAEDELRRVLPVVRGLAARGRVPISIDTYKAVVAREAVAAGASIVNDISGLQYDLDLGRAMADTGAAVILMHTRGRSSQMYELAVYADVVREVRAELQAAVDRAVAAGVRPESIIVDPGFGFAKRAEHSYAALAGLPEFAALGRPILSGPSRKSFLQLAIGERPPPGREWATAAAVTASVLLGAHIVRVHAVREMADVVRVADQVRGTGSLRHLSP